MIQRRTEKKDSAVSPVVGVMLMLVVTILIAAIVAVFASGTVTDIKTAPNAIIVEDKLNVESGSLTGITFALVNGDTLAVDNLKLELVAYGSTQTYGPERFTTDSAAITPGSVFTVNVDGCYFSTGTPVDWSIIDTTSGKAITSGSFVVA